MDRELCFPPRWRRNSDTYYLGLSVGWVGRNMKVNPVSPVPDYLQLLLAGDGEPRLAAKLYRPRTTGHLRI